MQIHIGNLIRDELRRQNNGTGEVKQDYNGWSSNLDGRKYCSKCGTTGPQHSYFPCPQCYGKGYK